MQMDCTCKQHNILLYQFIVAILDDVGDVLENIDIIERQKVLMLICLINKFV